MKPRELRSKSKGELQKLLEEKKGAVRELRFKLVRGEVKNVRELARVKREIARILTFLNEKTHAKTS